MATFKKGDLVRVTGNKLPFLNSSYHKIPIGTIVEIIHSDTPPIRAFGTYYCVWYKEKFTREFVYEDSMTALFPLMSSYKQNKEPLPDI